MRISLAVLLGAGIFSANVAAESQIPLKDKAAGWLDKAKSYIPSGVAEPVDAAAAAVAAKKVETINERNYARKLQPKLEGEEEWMVYMTGGNKSCFGRCGQADQSWNETVALLSALPQTAGSPPLHLGKVDCEKENVLCTGWIVNVPAIYHFILPQRSADPNAPVPKTELRIVELSTNITSPEMFRLSRLSPGSVILQDFEPYTGILHPIDGMLAKLGLQYYFGYALYLMGTTPSWAIMIFISFLSRQWLSRRTMRQRPDVFGQTGTGAAPASPQPAAVPAAAGKGTPGSAGKGGKKRR